jgi:hypothetical protein
MKDYDRFTLVVSVLDRQLLAALNVRSFAEFKLVRDKVLPRYVRALRALQDTSSNLLPVEVEDQLAASVITDLSGDLNKQELRFGKKLVEQAAFTLWTVGRIRAMTHEIAKAGHAPSDKKQADWSLFYEYTAASLWSQFHLDILFAAMKFDRPIREELRESICDGMKCAVNAYAIMKDALLLRLPVPESQPANALPWDEEDEQLLSASMRDVNADFSDNVH